MDLSASSGLPKQLNGDGKLTFSPQVTVQDYRTRTLDELIPVYLDQQACLGKQVAYEGNSRPST